MNQIRGGGFEQLTDATTALDTGAYGVGGAGGAASQAEVKLCRTTATSSPRAHHRHHRDGRIFCLSLRNSWENLRNGDRLG
jgi:hypothetical protein